MARSGAVIIIPLTKVVCFLKWSQPFASFHKGILISKSFFIVGPRPGYWGTFSLSFFKEWSVKNIFWKNFGKKEIFGGSFYEKSFYDLFTISKNFFNSKKIVPVDFSSLNCRPTTPSHEILIGFSSNLLFYSVPPKIDEMKLFHKLKKETSLLDKSLDFEWIWFKMCCCCTWNW